MSTYTLPVSLLQAPIEWKPGALLFLVDLRGHPLHVHLRQGRWHVWTTTPAFHLDPANGLLCEDAKRYLFSPFIASRTEASLVASQPTSDLLIEALKTDFVKSYTPTPLAVAYGDIDAFQQAIRDAMTLTGCYVVTEARHPSLLEQRPPLTCLEISTGDVNKTAANLFHLLLDAFRPSGIEVIAVQGTLECSQPMIDMPWDSQTHHTPSHHDRIDAAARLRTLFEARFALTGLEATDWHACIERLRDPNGRESSLDDLLNDAIAYSAW